MKIIIKKITKFYFKIKIIFKVYCQKLLLFVSKYSNKPLNRPTSIMIDVTQNCILHCRQCYLWKTKSEKQMTFKEAKIIIDKLHSWLGNFYLFFTGGEPFINKNLPKIIKYAQNIGIVCHVNSNAFLIDKKLARKIIDSNLDSISISLDGAKASTHDSLRGTPGTFKKVINAINLLHNGPKIYLNTVIMKPNTNELISLIKLAKKNKTNGINFQCLLPTLASKDNIKNTQKGPLWPKYKILKSQIQKIIKLNQLQKDILLANTDYLKQIINYYHNPINTNQPIVCEAGINNFIINKKGDVRLCFAMPPIGNMFKDSAKQIWINRKAQNQRKNIRDCQQVCKVIGCNKIDINRQIKVEFQSYNF